MEKDPWQRLRAVTAARIALGRAGGSVPTSELLSFRLAHAQARDAVHAPFVPEELADELRAFCPEVIVAKSAAPDRVTYLQRPDLGRRLDTASRAKLLECIIGDGLDLAIIVSDGLSTRAAQEQAPALLFHLLPMLTEWRIGPVVIVRHARVALQDEIGEIFRARISLMLLGERPGLGSTDSLGAYFTFAPAVGRTDAERNCISNIRAGGLAPNLAAAKLVNLLAASRRLGISGVTLKDDSFSLPELPGRVPATLV